MVEVCVPFITKVLEPKKTPNSYYMCLILSPGLRVGSSVTYVCQRVEEG